MFVSSQAQFLPRAGKKSARTRHQWDMTRRLTECLRASGTVDVAAWRRCRLLDAGFPPPLAEQLAIGHLDLHELLQLVDRGCPPELAVRILEPIGDGPR